MDIKDRIADVFEEELSKRDGDKITVKDIVNNCGISRQAFYYHFQDLPAVLEYAFQRKMESTFKRSSYLEEVWESIQILLDEIWNNRKYIQKLRKSKHMDMLLGYLVAAIEKYLKQMENAKSEHIIALPKEINPVIEFYAGGIAMTMIRKCDEKEFNSEKYAKFLEQMIRGKIVLIDE